MLDNPASTSPICHEWLDLPASQQHREPNVNIVFIILQHIIPQHLLSRLVGRLAECEAPWLKNLLITRFIKQYKVDMSEAAEPDPAHYSNFNAFFTRALRDGARPIDDDPKGVCCPADGAISQLGNIQEGRIFQAKGQDYSLHRLLGGDPELAATFAEGSFATIYLSPRDYHRVHMPVTGTLRSMTYVPGDLFSVNTVTAENVQGLFARNERAVCVFDTEFGPMAMVLVGAMIVAGIETVWAGQVAPIKREVIRHDYQKSQEPIVLEKGAEMGRFKLGSTVILLFGHDQIEWLEKFTATTPTRLGQALATAATSPVSDA